MATMAMTGVLPHVKCIPTSFISRLTHDPTTVLALTYKLKSPVPSLRGQGIASAVASRGFTRTVSRREKWGAGGTGPTEPWGGDVSPFCSRRSSWQR